MRLHGRPDSFGCVTIHYVSFAVLSRSAFPTTDTELKQTTFVKVALDECSAKVSAGFPEEPIEDLALDVWAGILPLRTVPGEPVADPLLRPETAVPGYISAYRRPEESDR